MHHLQRGKRMLRRTLRRSSCFVLCCVLALGAPMHAYAAAFDLAEGDALSTSADVQQTEGQGFAIWVDQWEAVLCRTQEDAQWVLNSLLADYRTGDTKVSFKQQVEILPGSGTWMSREEALYVLQNGGVCLDLLQQVQQRNPLSTFVEVMQSVQKEERLLQEQGQEANEQVQSVQALEIKPRPLVNVLAVQSVTEETSISFSTKRVNDSTLKKGETVVTQQGVKGSKRRTVVVTCEDGVEISRAEGKWEIVTQPVQQVMRVGTKLDATPTPAATPTPDAKPTTTPAVQSGTPSFGWPVSSRTITSRFGEGRGSRKHAGIDIDGNTGDPVVASAEGKVVRVRNDASGYGLYVDIDHGNGWKTRYAHNSKILVKVGQQVTKGQAIAKVGNTGASSGSHLHFEILKNGSAKNPLSYLP